MFAILDVTLIIKSKPLSVSVGIASISSLDNDDLIKLNNSSLIINLYNLFFSYPSLLTNP